MRLTGSIYLSSRFFLIGGTGAALLFISYGLPFLLLPAILTEILLVGLTVYEITLLYGKRSPVTGKRNTTPIWSLGSESEVSYILINQTSSKFHVTLTDEIPEQFQERDHKRSFTLLPSAEISERITLRPLTRGRYCFGKTWLFLSTSVKLVERRIAVADDLTVQVYPSIEQMKKLELASFNKPGGTPGARKIRRFGNTQEFEQIKAYAIGDDQKRINWRSTGKRAEIMVNQYQEERSQQIYCVIDKSRVMDFVSNGLTLLDYSINAALILSNIALQKQDKAGLITYSSKPGTFVKADKKSGHLKVILENLYKEKESASESNIELLYHVIRKNITQRSLLVFFTNFESTFSLDRSLPVLRKLNKSHVVMVIFFDNEEIRTFTEKEPEDLPGVYDQVIAEKYLFEKKQIQIRLKNYGIQAIITKPDQLAVNVINKYLELKSRGVI